MKLHNNEVDGKEDVTPTYKLALLVTQTKRIVFQSRKWELTVEKLN